MKFEKISWKIILIFLFFSIIFSSYYLYFLVKQPNTQLFTVSEREGKFYGHPGPDELFAYGLKISAFSQHLFKGNDPYIKEYTAGKAYILELFPLVFFGLLLKISTLNFMYLFSLISLTFIKFLLLFYIFSSITKNRYFNIMSPIIVVAYPLFFLYPFYFLYHGIKIGFFSKELIITMGQELTPYFYSFRLYHGLFSWTLFIGSFIIIYYLVFKEINLKKRIVFTFLLALNFYTYFYQWIIIGGAFLFLQILTIKKKYKPRLFSFVLYVIFGIPALIIITKKGLLSSNPERFMLEFGLLKDNLTLSIYFLFFFLASLILFTYLNKKEHPKLTIFHYSKLLLQNHYFLITLSLFISSLILMNINLVIPFPQAPFHFNKFNDLLLALIVLIQLALLVEMAPSKNERKIRRFIPFILLMILLVISVVPNLALTQYHPIPPFEESRRELYSYLKTENITEKIIMTVDIDENSLLVLYTNNYVIIGNAFSSEVGIAENLERYGFIINTLNLNKSLVINDLITEKKTGVWSAYHYLVHGTFFRRNNQTLKMENILTQQDTKTIIKIINEPKRRYSFDYVLAGPLEKKYGFKGLNTKDYQLIFKNKRYELYRHCSKFSAGS
ncbi:MAG: hypothetical protein AB1668_00480 [Nanoarchaeota archaeon]